MKSANRIVVLDGYTLNPGDLSWDSMRSLAECEIYDRSKGQEIVERAQPATIVLTNKAPLSSETISQLQQLKYIGVLATGFNIIDVAAAKQCGIVVTNVPRYGTDSVAQTAFSHILNLTQHIAHHAASVRAGTWSKSDDWCYWEMPLLELSGQTLGIIGFGRIGRAVARIGHVFGMNVLAYAPQLGELPDYVQAASLSELLSQSDVVSLHCPLAADNERLINSDTLTLMKRSAILINTSRGGLIDERALANALNSEQIAGAGLDVLTREPPHSDNPLLNAKNCHITPHIAWATRAARQRLMHEAVENVSAFLAGKPRNVVN